jgi:hypothetical protein
MFTKNNSSNNDTQANPFIRTMKGDLNAANEKNSPTVSSPKEEKISVPQKDSEIKTTSQPAKETSVPTIDASSPFYNAPQTPSLKPVVEIKEKEIEQVKEEIKTQISEKKTEPTENKTKPAPEKKEDISWTKLFVILSSSLIVIIAAVAGYFYWQNKSTNEAELLPNDEQETISINPAAEKYSTENPNYLQLDVNKTDAEIKEELKQMAENVAKLQSKVPVEFIITDQNNNPIAFHIFAAVLKLDFSQQILDTLDDNFSLFALQDETVTRLGLAIKTKDAEAARNELNQNENILPDSLKPLFLDEVVVPANKVFEKSTYNDAQIHYFNIDSNKKQSIDYTITNNLLLIGTSKQTLRSIIDKANQNQAPSTPSAEIQIENQTPNTENQQIIPPVNN